MIYHHRKYSNVSVVLLITFQPWKNLLYTNTNNNILIIIFLPGLFSSGTIVTFLLSSKKKSMVVVTTSKSQKQKQLSMYQSNYKIISVTFLEYTKPQKKHCN